jgi:catechol 2,3-dioxygenase-like lactoylglutathione lyase family enzyme
MMISHLSLGVADLERSTAFYDAALGALGYVRLWSNARAVGYGEPGQGDKLALFLEPQASRPGAGFHLALVAGDREAVDAFHLAAMLAGGGDHGGPGPRAAYGPTYYAAFVADPDGHKIEAVFR